MVLYFSRTAVRCILVLVLLLAGLGLLTVTQPVVQSVAALLSARLVPIYKVDTSAQRLAISFDATWGADQTDQLLEILAQNNVLTTFFLAGNWLENYPDQVRKIAAAGHEIGNHSYAHAHMNSLTPEQITADISKTHVLIKAICGQESRVFRPPFGEYSNKVIKGIQELNYYPIQWSIDSLDWKDVSAEFMVEKILSQAGPGDIILFHNAGKHTPKAVAQILPELIKRGFQIVPVGELIYKENYYIESHSGTQRLLPSAETTKIEHNSVGEVWL
jgi:polysaccharide deacetylase family sporulation protein PdaB